MWGKPQSIINDNLAIARLSCVESNFYNAEYGLNYTSRGKYLEIT